MDPRFRGDDGGYRSSLVAFMESLECGYQCFVHITMAKEFAPSRSEQHTAENDTPRIRPAQSYD
jgi:hypothetical protein